MLKATLLLRKSVRKNMECAFLLCFGVYTPTKYALSGKIAKFKFYGNGKKSK